jgi:hypothetical protein
LSNDWFGDVANFFCCFEDEGDYQTALSNGGEKVTVVDACGVLQTEVDYDDTNGWPEDADGACQSLELKTSALSSGSINDATLWQASCLYTVSGGHAHGTPGSANSDVDAGCPPAPLTCTVTDKPCDATGGSLSGSMVGCNGMSGAAQACSDNR